MMVDSEEGKGVVGVGGGKSKMEDGLWKGRETECVRAVGKGGEGEWAPGLQGSWTPGHLGLLDLETPGPLDSWTSEPLDLGTSGPSDPWTL